MSNLTQKVAMQCSAFSPSDKSKRMRVQFPDLDGHAFHSTISARRMFDQLPLARMDCGVAKKVRRAVTAVVTRRRQFSPWSPCWSGRE
jgi:hypothetical protein